MIQDLRYAWRSLTNAPGFAVVAVLALGLGISVNTTFFALVNAICLRGLPLEHPDQVLYLSTRNSENAPAGFSYLEFEDLRSGTSSFAGLAAYSGGPLTISPLGPLTSDTAPAERVAGTFISAGAFRMLDAAPRLGREFTDSDDRTGAPPVAVLSGAVWKSRYAADPAVIGRAIRLNGAPATIVGVMPDGFLFPANTGVWLPLSQQPGLTTRPRDARSLSVFGQLRSGTTVAGARAEVEVIGGRLASEHSTNAGIRFVAVPINEQFNGRVTDTVWMAFITAGLLVLLVACANVANLLLMRSMGRSRELAIRAAIGASRWRLTRQLLVESALISSLAALVALVLSVGGLNVLSGTVPASAPLPYFIRFVIDARVFAALLLVSAASVFVCGLVPAVQASRTSPNDMLKDGGRRTAGGSRSRRWTSTFLIVEFGLSLVLLANVAYVFKNALEERNEGAAVDTAGLLTASVALPAQAYATPLDRARFLGQVEDDLRSISGVSAVAVASGLPLSGTSSRKVIVDGRDQTSLAPPETRTLAVGNRYFETLVLPVVQGRAFETADQDTAIVNEHFVKAVLAGAHAVGRRIKLVEDDKTAAAAPWKTIVGVAPTIQGAVESIVYVPYRTEPSASAVLLLRTAGDRPASLAGALREKMRQADPDLPLFRVMSMSEAFRDAEWNGRVSAGIINTISAIAFLLALVGLYAVTAHGVLQRTHELGVRLALGARPRALAWLVLRRALAQLAAGLGFGVIATAAFQRYLMSSDSPSSLTEPASFGLLVTIVVLVAMLACVAPALRAARLDPLTSLRAD